MVTSSSSVRLGVVGHDPPWRNVNTFHYYSLLPFHFWVLTRIKAEVRWWLSKMFHRTVPLKQNMLYIGIQRFPTKPLNLCNSFMAPLVSTKRNKQVMKSYLTGWVPYISISNPLVVTLCYFPSICHCGTLCLSACVCLFLYRPPQSAVSSTLFLSKSLSLTYVLHCMVLLG